MLLRFRALPSLLLVALSTACAPAVAGRTGAPAPLAAELGAVFDDTAFANAHWGVVVRSLGTGETLYRRNGEKLFVPASNMKLITGAAALEALGPEFRYRTRIAAAGPVQRGVLRGDLVVHGGGDPTISARFGEDARDVLRTWADSLRAHGITRIAGGILGVDEYFDDVLYGRGWAWDDMVHAYSAPVAGLQFNDAAVRVHVFPGRSLGDPGLVSLEPATAHLRIANQTTTVEAGRQPRVAYTYVEAGGALLVTGEVPRDTVNIEANVAVREPVRYFVTNLREALRESGIAVDGPALVAGDREEDDVTIARRAAPIFTYHSPPMREIVPAFMKPSQNQIAEMLLKTLGRELRGVGSAAAGTEAVDSLLGVWGLPSNQLLMADGSGLSRYNYLTPDLLMALLEHMTRSPNWEVWRSSLPIAGVDGTLRNRMRETAADGNVRAKTGTLSNVRALSGYVTTADGERLAFSMIVNNHALTARDADRLVDAALVRLASFSRRGESRTAVMLRPVDPVASGR